MTETDVTDLTETGVVAVLRGMEPDTVVEVVEALVDGGIDALEITMDAPDAPAMIRTVVDEVPDTVAVGAGTVLDPSTARTALAAGASFVVAPTTDPDTIATCNRYGAPIAPGVATPTEALNAFEAGAEIVKLFPAAPLGPDYLGSLRGPLDQIPVLPTGGIGPENAAAFFQNGAAAVGVGSALVDQDAIARGDYDVLTATAEELVQIAAEATPDSTTHRG